MTHHGLSPRVRMRLHTPSASARPYSFASARLVRAFACLRAAADRVARPIESTAMTGHTVEHDPNTNGPNAPAPQDAHEPCEGTITLNCHCARLRSRTMAIRTGPMSAEDFAAYIEHISNNYENSGYVVLGQSSVSAGGGWGFGLTVGWYA